MKSEPPLFDNIKTISGSPLYRCDECGYLTHTEPRSVVVREWEQEDLNPDGGSWRGKVMRLCRWCYARATSNKDRNWL